MPSERVTSARSLSSRCHKSSALSAPYAFGKDEVEIRNSSHTPDGGRAMKNTRWFLLIASLLMPAMAMAQSVFDGTWKVDLKTAKFPTKPDVYLLQDGMYHCKTCVPSVDVKADRSEEHTSELQSLRHLVC